MSVSKKAATEALLGAPVSAAAPAKKVVKKVKKKDGVGGAVNLEKKLLQLLGTTPKGMSQESVCEGLSCQPSDILDIVNHLLNKHRIELLQDGEGAIFYKIVSADKVEKLRGLVGSEMLIYQLIEKSENQGIWIKDLRRKSNLSALEIPKILKELMKRKLIKCEKSIQATNKKVYMLYDIEPARDVTGGAWYDKATGEFDTEYMKALESGILLFLEKKLAKYTAERDRVNRGLLAPEDARETGAAGADEVEHFLRETGAFKTVPSEDESAKIMQGLVYEGRLTRQEDEGREWMKQEAAAGSGRIMTAGASAAAAASERADAERPLATRKRRRNEVTYAYRFVKSGAFQSAFQQIPCATCPVAKNCHEGNPISPQSCEYLAQWLQF